MSNGHRDGLEVMNFLFDFINELSGYSEKYFDEVLLGSKQEAIDKKNDLVLKYRKEKND